MADRRLAAALLALGLGGDGDGRVRGRRRAVRACSCSASTAWTRCCWSSSGTRARCRTSSASWPRAPQVTPFGTSIPPQSPVAWSNFITGRDPGGHGIFDFIHRDPQTMLPFFSASEAKGPPDSSGSWGAGRSRAGAARCATCARARPSGSCCAAAGVDATIFKVPSNFPPVDCEVAQPLGHGHPRHHRQLRHLDPDHRRSAGRARPGRRPHRIGLPAGRALHRHPGRSAQHLAAGRSRGRWRAGRPAWSTASSRAVWLRVGRARGRAERRRVERLGHGRVPDDAAAEDRCTASAAST